MDIIYMRILMRNTLMTFEVFNDVQNIRTILSLYFIQNNIFNMLYWDHIRTKFAP